MKDKAHRFFDDQHEVDYDRKLHNFLLGSQKENGGVKIVRKSVDKTKAAKDLIVEPYKPPELKGELHIVKVHYADAGSTRVFSRDHSGNNTERI